MPRFLHTADWQVGRAYQRFAADDAAQLAEARIATVARIAALAAEHRVDAVLVAGDVFDAQTVSDKTVRRLFNALAGFQGPWLMIPGNHDAALAASVMLVLSGLSHADVLDAGSVPDAQDASPDTQPSASPDAGEAGLAQSATGDAGMVSTDVATAQPLAADASAGAIAIARSIDAGLSTVDAEAPLASDDAGASVPDARAVAPAVSESTAEQQVTVIGSSLPVSSPVPPSFSPSSASVTQQPASSDGKSSQCNGVLRLTT